MKATKIFTLALMCAVAVVSCKQRDFVAEIDDAMNSYHRLCDSIYRRTDIPDSVKLVILEARYDSLNNVLETLTDEALKEHSGDSLAVDIIALQYNLELIDGQEALSRFGKVDSSILNRPEIKQFCTMLENKAKTCEGCQFVDFEVVQPDGRSLKLSDFAGCGRYCLVDFWASWCGPCRGEIPNVKEAFDTYFTKGLNVVSVAVWDKVEDTQVAAEELGITWTRIDNAQSIPTDLYGIDGIPHIMLISPEGKILSRGLRGKEIMTTLAGYIK